MDPAPHARRFAAGVIDFILQLIFVAAGVSAVLFIEGVPGWGLLCFATLLALAYEPAFVAAKGATLGKSAMKLRVVNEYGERVTAGQSIARYVFKQTLNFLVISLLVPLFSDRRRALHDMIVSTYVVEV